MPHSRCSMPFLSVVHSGQSFPACPQLGLICLLQQFLLLSFHGGMIDTQKLAHIQCTQLDEFGHVHTPVIPSQFNNYIFKDCSLLSFSNYFFLFQSNTKLIKKLNIWWLQTLFSEPFENKSLSWHCITLNYLSMYFQQGFSSYLSLTVINKKLILLPSFPLVLRPYSFMHKVPVTVITVWTVSCFQAAGCPCCSSAALADGFWAPTPLTPSSDPPYPTFHLHGSTLTVLLCWHPSSPWGYSHLMLSPHPGVMSWYPAQAGTLLLHCPPYPGLQSTRAYSSSFWSQKGSSLMGQSLILRSGSAQPTPPPPLLSCHHQCHLMALGQDWGEGWEENNSYGFLWSLWGLLLVSHFHSFPYIVHVFLFLFISISEVLERAIYSFYFSNSQLQWFLLLCVLWSLILSS